MEIATQKLTVAVCIIALTVIVGFIGKVLVWVWLRPKRLERLLRDQGCQGNSYSLFFGDLKAMAKMMNEAISKPINIADDILPRVLPFHYWLVNDYGKNNYLIWRGPEPTVNITRPEQIKDVLNKNYTFQRPTNHPLAKFHLTGLLDLEGEKWAKHRKIISPAFHLEKLKLMLPAFHQCCNQMIKEWKTLVSEKGSCELDVWPFLRSMTGDTISRTAFGSSFEEGKRIFELLIEQSEFTTKVLRSIYIPGWRFVPTKQNKRMKEIENEIQCLIRGIIHKREKAMKEGEAPDGDLLGLLLESNNREIKEHGNNVGMSIEEVVNECKLFYNAGHMTTSILLNWTIVLLSRFPNWQEKAREEIKEVFGTKEPDYDGLSRLKVVTMILYEVLRLYPPAPLIGRVVGKETKLGNLTLPAGTRIWVPVVRVHHDEELWGNDAKEFNPERFSEGVSKATKGQVSFLPFGWGPRLCIGQNFALLEAKMAVSLILQHFSFELSPSYTHAPFARLLLLPQFGTHIILHKL